jgi:hypothetical protein
MTPLLSRQGPHFGRSWDMEARAAFALAAALLASCSGNGATTPGLPASPTPGPTPTGVPGLVDGASTGPTTIAFVSADPALGSTIAGCGAHASGCAGRIRMTFRLTPIGTGPVLFCTGFLHAADKTGCLQGRTGAFSLRAGEAQTVEVVFDQVDSGDRCRTPLDLTDLAFGVEGTVDVASRHEWALRYHLAP